MIDSIHLKNFKQFEAQSIKLGSLTLLAGLNGMGKSSIIQAFLLLRQSYQQRILESTGLALNGELASVGMAKDALFENATSDKIGFSIGFGNGINAVWEFDYNREADILSLSSSPVPPETYQLSLFTDQFQYLQAERLGPRKFFEISDFQVRQHQQLGKSGEYTAHFLSIFRDEKISKHSLLLHPKAVGLTLMSQVEAWLGEVSPNTRIHLMPSPNMDLVGLQYSLGSSQPYRATNVGFGITYTLPVITAVLAAKPGDLQLLENPEAHLHPKGQARMGYLLALAAAQGIQIVVETHSDHVLNGIRLAVHAGKLSPEKVQLHFLQRSQRVGQAVSEVVSPRMNRQGRIDQWPDGFFDEWDNSLAALLEPIEE